ncbi:MAG: STAS domain-containing protein [Planctomycetota bacterium]
MTIQEKDTDGAVVLVPDSNITWRNQPELKRVLDHLGDEGRTNVIIDLTNVEEISGYGLGLLASRCGRLRREHGDIRLANASKLIKRLLEVTNLDELFEQYPDTDRAVRSFTIVHRGSQGDGQGQED